MIIAWLAIAVGLFCFFALVLSSMWVMELCQRRWGDTLRSITFGVSGIWLAAVLWAGAAFVGINAVVSL